MEPSQFLSLGSDLLREWVREFTDHRKHVGTTRSSSTVAPLKLHAVFAEYCSWYEVWKIIIIMWSAVSRDIIGHVTIRFPIGHYLLVVIWNQASIYNGFRDIQWRMWCNGGHDLKRPLKKGQGHSFWYHQFLIYNFLQAVNSNFCSRMHSLATINNVTNRRQTTDAL